MAVDLQNERCLPCEGGVPPMSPDEVRALLSACPDWNSDNQVLERTYRFKDFREALAFVNRVGELAEQQGHHPDVGIFSYNQVRLSLSTHAINGLSRNDFILAYQIDRLLDRVEK